MRAKADGYTILMGHMGTHAVSVSLYPNLAYKPDVDFEPIGVVIEVPIVIVARKNFPANDLKEFMAYVRTNAAKLNMAHAGVGSNIFNFGLLLNSLLGVRPTLVPFTGAGPATNALLSGQVDYMCNGVPESGSHIQAGMLKLMQSGPPNVTRPFRMSRPRKRLGCQNFKRHLGLRCLPPRARRNRFVTRSAMPSTKHWMTRACVSVCSTSAPIYRPRPHEVSSHSRYWLRAKLPAGRQS